MHEPGEGQKNTAEGSSTERMAHTPNAKRTARVISMIMDQLRLEDPPLAAHIVQLCEKADPLLHPIQTKKSMTPMPERQRALQHSQQLQPVLQPILESCFVGFLPMEAVFFVWDQVVRHE